MGIKSELEYAVGDHVITKKPHPCGSSEWVILRVGADVKIKCLSCDRLVMLDIQSFKKSIKKIIPMTP